MQRAGEAVAPILAAQEYGTVLMLLRSEQLRLGELTDSIEAITRSVPDMFAWRGPLAWAYAQGGRIAEARAELAMLRNDHFAALPRDVNFDVGLAILAHVADELGDGELAAEIEPLLRPARRPVDRVRHRDRDARARGLFARRLQPAGRPLRHGGRRLRGGDRQVPEHARAAVRRRTPPCGWPAPSPGGARPATPNAR